MREVSVVHIRHGIHLRRRRRHARAWDADGSHVSASHDRWPNLGHVSKIGAFAEHTVVSADSIVKVDPHLPLIPAALLACAIPTGYGSAVHRANVREGDTVVVVGTGGIGTAALQGARINGASCIVAVEPVEFTRTSATRSVPLTPRLPPRNRRHWSVN